MHLTPRLCGQRFDGPGSPVLAARVVLRERPVSCNNDHTPAHAFGFALLVGPPKGSRERSRRPHPNRAWQKCPDQSRPDNRGLPPRPPSDTPITAITCTSKNSSSEFRLSIVEVAAPWWSGVELAESGAWHVWGLGRTTRKAQYI